MIDKKQVQHIAKLARIELSEKKIKKFQKELSSILDYVEQLNKVKTGEVESIKQITGLTNIARSDIETRNPNIEIRNKILKNTPKKKQDYIKVPKILE